MRGRYAQGTQVSADRTQMEIQRILMRWGADKVGFLSSRTKAEIFFEYRGKQFRMSIDLPDPGEERFTLTPTGRKRRAEPQVFAEWEKETRRLWRSLRTVVKAMLIAVEDGVFEFDEAFLPFMLLSNNQTFGQAALPKIDKLVAGGNIKLLEVQ